MRTTLMLQTVPHNEAESVSHVATEAPPATGTRAAMDGRQQLECPCLQNSVLDAFRRQMAMHRHACTAGALELANMRTDPRQQHMLDCDRMQDLRCRRLGDRRRGESM